LAPAVLNSYMSPLQPRLLQLPRTPKHKEPA
jgi:hypothetical protein